MNLMTEIAYYKEDKKPNCTGCEHLKDDINKKMQDFLVERSGFDVEEYNFKEVERHFIENSPLFWDARLPIDIGRIGPKGETSQNKFSEYDYLRSKLINICINLDRVIFRLENPVSE